MGKKQSKFAPVTSVEDCLCYAFARVLNSDKPSAKEGLACSCISDHVYNSLQSSYDRELVLKKTMEVATGAGFSHEDVLLKLFSQSDPYIRLFSDTEMRSSVKRYFASL